MTIETKFNISENVFFILNNKIVSFKIMGIRAEISRNYLTIEYSFLTSKAATSMDKDCYEYKDEKDVFKSPVDIINSFTEQSISH